ncbi:hypothetical protein [Caballeronia sp. NCTM5]|uniref:hypothetical protein n=1 Tax=Caballeronia sp. NCTM5 TaxID=2921755 RepID=UPI002027FB02|nr:hypothetical protein [Caballeronia sp. NCTM5]
MTEDGERVITDATKRTMPRAVQEPYTVALVKSVESIADTAGANSQDAIAIAKAAINAMTEFHAQAEPDDTSDMNPTFPAEAFRKFVDEHARLMFRVSKHESNPTEPAYIRLRVAAQNVCAVLGYHGEISGRDDRVQALLDALYETDDGAPEKAKPVRADTAGAKPEPLVTLSGAQLLEAFDYVAPDHPNDPDQLECDVTIAYGEGHSGKGHYCWITDYPDEGAILLDGKQAEGIAAPPAPSVADAAGASIDKRAIAWDAHNTCARIPGATHYNAAEIAIDAVLQAIAKESGND